MSEREIDSCVQDFRQNGVLHTRGTHSSGRGEHNNSDNASQHQAGPLSLGKETLSSLRILVMTDAPLRVIDKELTPLGPTLLINYDVPIRKEDYVRRMMTILGSRSRTSEGQRLTINFIEAGQITKLRQFESFAEREVKEMPVQVADILTS
jgi:hypothetical protein